MNILDRLKSKFNIAEPIFDYEIKEIGFSDEDIYDTIEDNVFEELTGVSIIPCRIFYLVGYSDFTNDYIKLYSNSLSVIEKYFIGNNFEKGYYFGLTLQNKLGLSTQVPAKLYIQSRRAEDIIDTSYCTVYPNSFYTVSDLDYICLAEILNFKGKPEYNLLKTVQDLKLKCTDVSILNKYTKDRRL